MAFAQPLDERQSEPLGQVGGEIESESMVRIGLYGSLVLPADALWRMAAHAVQPPNPLLALGIRTMIGPFMVNFPPSTWIGIYAVGYTVATFVIGRMIIKEPRSRFGAFLIGWVIVRLVALVPILAGIAWFVLALLGLGVIAAAARRRERGSRESVTQEISVPPPPPPA